MQKVIKQTNMTSAARLQIVGGGAPIIKNRRRRPQIDGGAAQRGRRRALGSGRPYTAILYRDVNSPANDEDL